MIYINNTSNLTTEVFGKNNGLTVSSFFSRDNAYEYSQVTAGQILADYAINNHDIKVGLSYLSGENNLPDRRLLRLLGRGKQAKYI